MTFGIRQEEETGPRKYLVTITETYRVDADDPNAALDITNDGGGDLVGLSSDVEEVTG